MRLEAITAKVKPRSGWESLDLGFRMVHQHWLSLYSIWFGLTLPVFLLACWLFNDNIGWVIIGFWWLKPIFETAILNYLSRALFGEFPTFKSTLSTFHRYAFRQWFGNLTWRRFSPTRSMDLPVAQLEGLSGDRRGRRISTLHAFNSSAAVWLTLLFILFQVMFYFNLLALVFWLTPEVYLESILVNEMDLLWAENSIIGQFVQALIMYLIMSFFSPFYVAGGFSIYINQRTILEAWDIELIFKKLSQRVAKNFDYLKSISSAVLPIIFACCLISLPPTVEAADDDSSTEISKEESLNTPEKTEIKEQLNKILEAPPFKRTEKSSEVKFEFDLDYETNDSREKENSSSNTSMLGFFGGLAQIAEVFLWLGVGALVIWLLIKIFDLAPAKRAKIKSEKARPEVLFGLDISEQALPEDPSDECLKLWELKEYRRALSLLLRAALIKLIDQHHCQFEDGYTELECARVVKHSSSKSVSEFFDQLIQVWRLFAYAHKLPESSQVALLAEEFKTVFKDADLSDANNHSELNA